MRTNLNEGNHKMYDFIMFQLTNSWFNNLVVDLGVDINNKNKFAIMVYDNNDGMKHVATIFGDDAENLLLQVELLGFEVQNNPVYLCPRQALLSFSYSSLDIVEGINVQVTIKKRDLYTISPVSVKYITEIKDKVYTFEYEAGCARLAQTLNELDLHELCQVNSQRKE